MKLVNTVSITIYLTNKNAEEHDDKEQTNGNYI